jgi:hypothetical protein
MLRGSHTLAADKNDFKLRLRSQTEKITGVSAKDNETNSRFRLAERKDQFHTKHKLQSAVSPRSSHRMVLLL